MNRVISDLQEDVMRGKDKSAYIPAQCDPLGCVTDLRTGAVGGLYATGSRSGPGRRA